MTFEIKDYFETPVILEPRVELYTVYDFMGKELPGLAIVLDMPIQMGVQVSCSVHAKVSEENRLLGDAGRYPRYHPGPM